MWILLFLASLLLGYLSIAYWRNDFSRLEKISLSFSLGMGEISLLMFFLGLAKIPLTAQNILVITLFFCFAISLFLIFKTGNIFKISKPNRPRITLFEFPLILLIIFLVFWSLSQTVVWPPWEWDVLALYDFRGKVMAQDHSLATEYFTSQPNQTAYNYVYPFSTSLMHTLIYVGGGSNPQFIYSLFYTSLVFLTYCCLRRRLSRLQSLVMAAVLTTTPEILFPSTIAYPNIPYALYFGLSTIYFWEWITFRKTGFFIVSALFLGISSWIRNSEPFWLINILFILFFLAREKRFKLAGIYLAIFLPIRQLWPIFQGYIFSHTKDIFFSLPQPFSFNLTKVPEVFFFVLKFFISDWLEYLLVLGVCLILFRQTNKKNSFILVWLVGYLVVAIAGTYFFAVSFPWWNQVGGSASRLSVFFAALLLYTISTFCPSSVKGFSTYIKKASIIAQIDRARIKIFKWP